MFYLTESETSRRLYFLPSPLGFEKRWVHFVQLWELYSPIILEPRSGQFCIFHTFSCLNWAAQVSQDSLPVKNETNESSEAAPVEQLSIELSTNPEVCMLRYRLSSIWYV